MELKVLMQQLAGLLARLEGLSSTPGEGQAAQLHFQAGAGPLLALLGPCILEIRQGLRRAGAGAPSVEPALLDAAARLWVGGLGRGAVQGSLDLSLPSLGCSATSQMSFSC